MSKQNERANLPVFSEEPEHKTHARFRESRPAILRSIVYGAAVGDALGVPYEFMRRDTFECVGMSSGGAHNMPTGTFSDDTSLILATCDSIKRSGGCDLNDMRKRFCAWLHEGRYTPDGTVFDVGNATATALNQGCGCAGERDNGNGSLMRIAPLAVLDAADSVISEVSAITHAHRLSREACVCFANILRSVAMGLPLNSSIEKYAPKDDHFAFLKRLENMPQDEVRSSGFVLDTLGAALWCALHTDSYRDCVLAAVNLGDDSDTTACVAGALAGAMYGFEAIPHEWVDVLRGKDVIEGCLF